MTPFAWSGILIAVSSFGFGLLVLAKSENRRLARTSIWVMIPLTIWGLGGVWIGTRRIGREALLAYRITYALGVIWTAPTFYDLVCTFLRIDRSRLIRIHDSLAFLLA